MNILVISQKGKLLGVAPRLVREGHSVKVLTELKKTGFGIYESIDEQELFSALKWCRFILSDCEHLESFYDRISMFNKPIIGANPYVAKANVSAIHEYAVFKNTDIQVPESRALTELSEIYRIAADWDLPNYDIRYGRQWFQGSHTEFMSWAVQQIPLGETVLLQAPIEDGTDVKVTGLFNGLEFLSPLFVSTVNNSKNRHCVLHTLRRDSALVDQNLIQLTSWLRAVDYRGPVSLRLTITSKGIYCRDMYVGFTYPDIYAILEAIQKDVGGLFNALAHGSPWQLDVRGIYFGAVEAIADNWQLLQGAPIRNIHSVDSAKHTFPVGTMKSDKEKEDLFVSGEIDTIYVATAEGSSIQGAKKRIVRTLNENDFPSMEFDSNIPLSANHPFRVLQDRNFLNG